MHLVISCCLRASTCPESPPGHTLVNKGEEQSPAQQQALTKLIDQFVDVFSVEPDRTQLVQDNIKSPTGVIIQEQPYRIPEAHHRAIEEEEA